jgi:hypothetical protein
VSAFLGGSHCRFSINTSRFNLRKSLGKRLNSPVTVQFRLTLACQFLQCEDLGGVLYTCLNYGDVLTFLFLVPTRAALLQYQLFDGAAEHADQGET